MAGKPDGFIALKSLRRGAPAPADALAEIRRIYFRTTPQTIANDLHHAIELLKSLPDENTRDRAAVYMDGLAQMRSEWAGAKKPKKRAAAGAAPTTGRKRRPG